MQFDSSSFTGSACVMFCFTFFAFVIFRLIHIFTGIRLVLSHDSINEFIIHILLLVCVLQHDAACRVIARLKKERDEARILLAQAERQIPISSSVTAAVNASAVSNGKRGSCSIYLFIFLFYFYL